MIKSDLLNNTKFAIFITIFKCCGKEGPSYSLISIDKIIALLKQMHGTQVKRRWVFQCIRDMIDAGLLSRKSRHYHRDDGTIGQISSIIAITIKGARLLISKQVKGAFLLLKNILAWIKNKDQRFPKKPDILGDITEKINPEGLRRLEDLISGVGKTVV